MTRSMAVATTSALRFHLGPEVRVELNGSWAALDWPTASHWCGTHGTAASPEMDSAPGRHRPISGWYSVAWGSAYPHSPSSDAGVPVQTFP